MNIENFFLPKFYGWAFHLRFRNLLNEAKKHSNHENHKPNTSIASDAAVTRWSTDEEIIADLYEDAKTISINLTTMNDKEEDYEEEMRNKAEELKREGEKERKNNGQDCSST